MSWDLEINHVEDLPEFGRRRGRPRRRGHLAMLYVDVGATNIKAHRTHRTVGCAVVEVATVVIEVNTAVLVVDVGNATDEA